MNGGVRFMVIAKVQEEGALPVAQDQGRRCWGICLSSIDDSFYSDIQ